MSSPPDRAGLPIVTWVGIFGLIFAALLAGRVLAGADWNPTVFSAFGAEAGPTTDYAEGLLGDVYLRPSVGHDGRFFYVQANDPWLLDPDSNAAVLDRPLYRSQRMFYPVLAGLGGLLSPLGVAWGLIAVNVVAMGVGTVAAARIARQLGGSSWLGLAFPLNLGFVSEMTIDGAGVVAAALAFLALSLLIENRMWLAVTLLSLSALTREAMLIVAFGSAVWLWRADRRRHAVLVLAAPVAGVVMWAAYLRLRLGFASGIDQVEEIGAPFVGFVRAFGNWLGDPMDLAVGVAMMILMVLFTWRVLQRPHLLGWAFLGFVPLGAVFTLQVWNSWFDISRAIAPVLTAYVLLLILTRREQPPASSAASARSRSAAREP